MCSARGKVVGLTRGGLVIVSLSKMGAMTKRVKVIHSISIMTMGIEEWKGIIYHYEDFK